MSTNRIKWIEVRTIFWSWKFLAIFVATAPLVYIFNLFMLVDMATYLFDPSGTTAYVACAGTTALLVVAIRKEIRYAAQFRHAREVGAPIPPVPHLFFFGFTAVLIFFMGTSMTIFLRLQMEHQLGHVSNARWIETIFHFAHNLEL